MATRGLIRFAKREEGVSFNEHPENVEVQIYNHYDSYPEGLGLQLAEFLSDFRVVNGLGSGQSKVANGMGCLAAQIVSHFKGDKAGDFYLYAPGTRDVGEQYIYSIYFTEKTLMIKISNMYNDDESFDGTIDEFGKWLNIV